jgi:two-component sensor histidine kinase
MEKLQASLREKEIMLSEIHHRVKNNLQIISSFIELQSDKIQNREFHQLNEDLNNRVRAMALIHDHLYHSSDFTRINFAEYIRIIANYLQESYKSYYRRCELDFNMEPIELGIVQAIPCGLMINEIISNSFKYAFPDSFTGEAKIRISFHFISELTLELAIGDNGIGLPETIVPDKLKTIGISLIYLLADQLSGTITIDRSIGTKYTLVFKKI